MCISHINTGKERSQILSRKKRLKGKISVVVLLYWWKYVGVFFFYFFLFRCSIMSRYYFNELKTIPFVIIC